MKHSMLIIQGILVILLLTACGNPKEELEKQIVDEENQVEETVKEIEDTKKEEDTNAEQQTDSDNDTSNHSTSEQPENTVANPTPSVKEQKEEIKQKQISDPKIKEPAISEIPDPKIEEPTISEIPDPKIEEPAISEIPDPKIEEPIIQEVSIPEPIIEEPTEEELQIDSIFVLVSMISLAFEKEKSQANCMVTIEAQNVEEIEGTITLQRKNDTGTYKKVKAWKVKQQSESFFFDTVYAVSKQGTYRLIFQGTLKNGEISKKIELQDEKTV